MSDTLKESILETAVQLFNKKGYAAVTMRDIAKELNISPGNLTYHFKKKSDLMNAVVQMIYAEHQNRHYSENVTLEELNELFKVNIEHQKKFFFYFYNIAELPQKYPEIAKMQVKVKKEFYNLFIGIFRNFIQKDIMKNEFKIGAYEDLAFAVLSILMFWVQQNSLKDDFISKQKDAVSIIWSVIAPNFTDHGIDLYNNLCT